MLALGREKRVTNMSETIFALRELAFCFNHYLYIILIVFSLFSPSLSFCLTFPFYLCLYSFSFTSISSSYLNYLTLLPLFSLLFLYSFILRGGTYAMVFLFHQHLIFHPLALHHSFCFFSYFEFIYLLIFLSIFSQNYLRNLKPKQHTKTIPHTLSCTLNGGRNYLFYSLLYFQH